MADYASMTTEELMLLREQAREDMVVARQAFNEIGVILDKRARKAKLTARAEVLAEKKAALEGELAALDD